MGNSNSSNGRRRHAGGGNNQNPPPQQPEINANRYIFTAPYPPQYPNTPHPPYYQYPTGSLPYYPYVDHQKAVTIRNDVNLKKESLKIQHDEQNPGRFLVEFTYDATVAGSITLYFFAKEGEDCNMTPTKDDMLQMITVGFQQGLGQRFRQESGTGIDFSTFDESEVTKVSETGVYPLAIKAEATPYVSEDAATEHKSTNCQITLAVFEKDKGGYHIRVCKQILWVNGMRYELQEIFGIGNSVDAAADFDGNDPGKECVICLSEPRDTTVLPCRHMCLCSGCAKVLRFQMN